MKINQLLAICGMAGSLFLGVGIVSAQNDTGGPSGGQGGGGGGGRGNFDPAQFQQRMMDNIKEQLGYTNDTDWNAVQPLIQKVVDARRDVGFGGGMGRMFRGNRGGGSGGDQANGNSNRRNFGPQPSVEAEALQNAIDANAPQLLTICGVAAALMLSAGTVSAQNDNGGNGGGGGAPAAAILTRPSSSNA